MDLTALFACTDCPGFLEGIWGAVATVALGAMVTLSFAASAAAEEAKARALMFLFLGGVGTLLGARYVAQGIWRLLDPGSVG